MGKRGRKPSERKGYFYEEQEQAVIDYVNSTDEKERNRIYNNILMPAFSKMVESIINRYKLYIPDEEFTETYLDTISFLMTKIHLFNPDSGYKAYSYCGTICKNYLIWRVKTYNKQITRVAKYDEVQNEICDSLKLSYKDTDNQRQFLTDLIKETAKKIETVLEKDKKLKENEIKLGKTLIFLLNNWEDIMDESSSNKFNKSSILLFIKENTNMNTKEIRDSMKKFKNTYFGVKNNLLTEYL